MRPAAGARTMARMLSPNTHTEEVPVLVVGGGPAGLAAAAELARHEIPTLLVERRVVLSSHPRATVLSLRSMELMRAWGLEAVVRSRGLEVDNRMLDGETLADAASGSLLWVGYPNREQSRALSPVDVACVAQDEVEPLLLAHLREQRSARVSLGTELTACGSGWTASVRRCATCVPGRCARSTRATWWWPMALAARSAAPSGSGWSAPRA